jgi:uncharacterized protein DUF4142/uncharacterized protein DUF3124
LRVHVGAVRAPAERNASGRSHVQAKYAQLLGSLKGALGDAFDRAYLDAMFTDRQESLERYKGHTASGDSPNLKKFAEEQRDQLPIWLGIVVLVRLPLLLIPLAVLTSERPESRGVPVLPAVAASPDPASLTERGGLYVPAYSSIYAGRGTAQIELTVTLSLRNASATDFLLMSA